MSTRASLRTFLTALAVLAFVPGSLLAQGKRTQAEIDSEIAFARGLAADWGFVDLAEEVVAGLESDVSGKSAEELALVKCDLYAEAARAERDPARRRELYTVAIEAYKAFIEKNAMSEMRSSAESRLVESAFTYARYIERDLEETVGEEAEQLKSQMVSVLMETVGMTEELVSNLQNIPKDERPQAQTLELYKLMLYRGQMLAVIARNDPENSYFFDQAIKSLEELVFEAGDGTPPALTAYKAIGDVYAYQEQWMEASAYYESVIEQTIPTRREEWDERKKNEELTPSDVALYFRFVELATAGVIDSYLAQGDMEAVTRYAMHFHNTWRREGVALEPTGYEALLAVARGLLASNAFIGGDLSGGEAQWYPTQEALEAEVKRRRDRTDTTSVAMNLANQVNAENKGTYLQVRAQKLISEISQQPGMSVSPELQLQAAEGEYYGGNNEESERMLRELMADLEAADESTRLEYAGKAYNLLGDSLRRQDRGLEAVIAYRTAVTEYAAADPQQNLDQAKEYNGMLRQVAAKATSNNDALKAWSIEAENALIAATEAAGAEGGTDGILWRRADTLYKDGDYDGAIAVYEEIPLDATYGERAFVQIGVCHFQKRTSAGIDAAMDVFQKYLQEIVPDPQYTSESTARQTKRKEATASAEFFLCLGHSLKKNYQDVIEIGTGYEERYPGQEQFSNWVLELVMKAHLAEGELAEGRSTFDVMLEMFPETERTAKAASSIYNELRAQLEDMVGQERVPVVAQMAELMELARTSGTAGYAEMYNEALHWTELGDLALLSGSAAQEYYSKAQTPLEILSERFAGDEKYGEKVQKFVQPRLGEIYVAQKLVVPAKEVLTPLVMNDVDGLSKQTVLTWVRATTGWLEGGGAQGSVTLVPGAGGTPEEFQKAIDVLTRITSSRDLENYSCEWYEVRLMIALTYHAWSKDDSSKADSAANQLSQTKINLGPEGWSVVDRECSDPEVTEETLRVRLGERALSSRFDWLERNL